jgi:hypothetical protein
MKTEFLSIKLLAVAASLFCAASAKADVIVTWENNAGDLVVRWNGDISNWVAQYNFNTNTVIMQTDNGMHALSGNVDLSWIGTTHNWYVGPDMYTGGVLTGDSFGTSGVGDWVYMPGNYSGQLISGSLTWAGQGALVSTFVAGSRDLGLGNNDNIIFRAYSPVPDSSATLALLGLGVLGLAGLRRRFAR